MRLRVIALAAVATLGFTLTACDWTDDNDCAAVGVPPRPYVPAPRPAPPPVRVPITRPAQPPSVTPVMPLILGGC